MKKLIAIILILVMLVPAALAEEQDPIVGLWYVTFDYSAYPGDMTEIGDRSFMIYIVKFDDNGSVTVISAEADKSGSIQAQGAKMGTWARNGDIYDVNILGIGSNKAELSDGSLLLQMTENVWYAMRPMVIGDWYSDIVVKF